MPAARAAGMILPATGASGPVGATGGQDLRYN